VVIGLKETPRENKIFGNRLVKRNSFLFAPRTQAHQSGRKMGVTESKEDQKLQEIWAVVDEDSDEEDKSKKKPKNNGAIKTPPKATPTAPKGGAQASMPPSKSEEDLPKIVKLPSDSPFPGIRLHTEEQQLEELGDNAEKQTETAKDNAEAKEDAGEGTFCPPDRVLSLLDSEPHGSFVHPQP
jgi:hypothetical protein